MSKISKISKRKELDMLSGSLWDKILLFALPIAATSILQQLFNSADVAVVGRFAGSRAMAAVGSNGAVINLLVNIFIGLSVGANVVIARLLGEGDKAKASRASHTAVMIALIGGIFVMIAGQFITPPILRMISTPDDIIDLAKLYLRIYFLGMPFIMLYNFGSAILRSRGDTRRPFLCLLVGGIVNVALNLFFVIVCRLSVAGVGIATVISNMISSGMIMYFLMHEKGALRIRIKRLRVHKDMLAAIAKIGIPAGLQGVVFSISNVCVQSALNSLGSDVVAGSSAALNFEFFAYFMLNSFTQACVTFTGQNYGALKYNRCKKTARWCLFLGTLSTAVLCLLFIGFGEPLVSLYTKEPAVAAVALTRMKFILVFEMFNSLMDVLTGSMRGFGYSLVPALITVIGVCGTRLLWVYLVFPYSPTFETLLWVYPISWVVTTVIMLFAYFKTRSMAFQKPREPLVPTEAE